MNYKQRSWAEINLDNLANNIEEIKRVKKQDARIIGVIKANGYGCGSVEAAKVLKEHGVDFFAVACIDEAVVLRKNNIEDEILILGNTDETAIPQLIEYNVIPAVYSYNFAKSYSDFCKQKNVVGKIHIKIDTGMGRIGFLYGYGEDEKTLNEIQKISRLDNIEIEGIFTHFSRADEEDKSYTLLQFSRFNECFEKLDGIGVKIKYKHCSNSASVMMYPEFHLDCVRPGIILYGCYPSDYLENKAISLKPVMSLKTKIVNLKEVNENHLISYGGTFKTSNGSKIATLPIGYADGLSRNLSGKYFVEIKGQKVPVVGKICMDQCMIDVTNVNNIDIGDEVEIFGGNIPVENMAKILGTINYEILCDVNERIPRVYLKGGKAVKIKTLVSDF